MKNFIAGILAGAVGSITLFSVTLAASQADYDALDVFGAALAHVHANYVREISIQELVDTALHGMLSSLDARSAYMDAEELSEARNLTSGSIPDVGLEITSDHGRIKVITPINGSPSDIGGLQPRDVLESIDGRSTENMTRHSAFEMLRGPEGSKVSLTIHRDGVPNTITVELVRKITKIESVQYRQIGDVGYIGVKAFGNDADNQIKRAVSALQQKIGSKLKGFVIDLRRNPGGLLDQAVAISDDFLDSGTIVAVRGRNATNDQIDSANPGDIADGKPIFVLTDAGTAAGAEIVASALQDNHRATIVGAKTFGEGTIQTIIPLGKCKCTALRLTTAQFYRPDGTTIEGIGVTPDFAIAQAGNSSNDNQLSYALDKLTTAKP